MFAQLIRLAQAGSRRDAAKQVAVHVGAEDLLLFVRDHELGVVIPAPGFPQTLQPGAAWRTLLAKCNSPGRCQGEIEWPTPGATAPFIAHTYPDGGVAVLLGGDPRSSELESLMLALPLVFAVLQAEDKARAAQAQATVALDASRQASNLTASLGAARTALEHALNRSAQLNVELQEADRRKDEFLAMLGHELRNPLAAISGALEVLRLPDTSEKKRERATTIVDGQTAQLSRLVDELLDIARISRGKVVLRFEQLNLADVVRHAMEATRALMTSKQHHLFVGNLPDVWVRGDPTRLEQITTNLLTNAAKYTNPGGHIEVEIERANDRAILRVKDSGIGIPQDHLESVFDSFAQVPGSHEHAAGGMGIGLTLVRQFSELHGGRAYATSEVGRGSEFVIELPALSEESIDDSEDATPQPVCERHRSYRVLIVDDNVDAGEMVEELVTAWGHRARRAADGPSALIAAAAFQPEIVLLDIGLPGMNGYEVARALRQMSEAKSARIVAVSGYGTKTDRARSEAAGIDRHMVKPVALKDLRSVIEE